MQSHVGWQLEKTLYVSLEWRYTLNSIKARANCFLWHRNDNEGGSIDQFILDQFVRDLYGDLSIYRESGPIEKA